MDNHRLMLTGLIFLSIGGILFSVWFPSDRQPRTYYINLSSTNDSKELYFQVHDTKTRVFLIGLDGASWNVMNPLIRAGRLPNIKYLMEGGVYGNLSSLTPSVSPIIWTSVATGKVPKKHGINQFGVRDNETGKWTPMTSNMRKTKAIWNILSDGEKKVGVVGWWATWPAEEVNGFLVSDRISYSRWMSRFNVSPVETNLVHPPELINNISHLLITPGDLDDEKIRGFHNLSVSTLKRSGGENSKNPIIREFMLAHSQDLTYHGMSIKMVEDNKDLDFFALYLRGIDIMSHAAMHQMILTQDGEIIDNGSMRFGWMVSDYYEFTDRLVGEVLGKVDDDAVVVVVSDHGFEKQKEGIFSHSNSPDGIIIISGRHVRRGVVVNASVLDVTPTILYLMDLPVADDMDGRVLTEVFDPALFAKYQVDSIPTYDTRVYTNSTPLKSGVDEAIEKRLRGIGYVL